MNIFFAWMLGFAPLAVFSPRKLSVLEWVLYLGFGWLALTGLRYVIWFLFIVAVFMAALLAGWFNNSAEPKQIFPALNFGLGIFLLILPLIFIFP